MVWIYHAPQHPVKPCDLVRIFSTVRLVTYLQGRLQIFMAVKELFVGGRPSKYHLARVDQRRVNQLCWQHSSLQALQNQVQRSLHSLLWE